MIYVVILLVVLVGSIIFVIEKREVNAIFEEQKNKGILTAKNIAQLNLDPFLFWDNEGVKESIEKQIDEKLIYIIFYDRNNRPFAANDFIMDYEEIYNHS
ncbi:MAG: HAMP domain-containing histidine kinase, partial [Acidobacteriota bacterium]|nr:HAMP domain-containing histidine kinase [Acidobacteriota bacterium]